MKSLNAKRPESSGRRSFLLGAASLAGAMPGLVRAQAGYPSGPIRIIVPSAAGGGIDATARIYGNKLSQVLKTSVVIENAPGAAGQIAARLVRNSKPDGQTLLWSSSSFAVVAPLAEVWPFDPTREFRTLARLLAFDLVLVVNPSLGVRSLKDLLARMRSERLAWGSPGLVTAPNIAASVFNERANGKGVAIPYNGSAPALNALLGGHVSYMFNTIDNLKGHIQAGKVLPVATLTKERIKGLEDVPTISEAGFPEMMATSWEFWYGAQAPAGIPREVAALLNDALYQANDDPVLGEGFVKMGLRPLPKATPDEVEKTVKAEIEQFGPLVKKVLAARP